MPDHQKLCPLALQHFVIRLLNYMVQLAIFPPLDKTIIILRLTYTKHSPQICVLVMLKGSRSLLMEAY